MAEHIDRDAFLEQERAWYCKNCIRRTDSNGKIVYEIGETPCLACHINDILDDVENCPAADVVERKVGKWLFWQDDPDANVYECSACHEPLTLNEGTPRENNFNFCPFCGLPMKEGDDDV